MVSAGVLLSRVLGYARDAAILGLLGVSEEAALYTNAFSLPDLLFFLMAGGYLSITLVPLLSRHLEHGDHLEAQRTFTAVFRVVAIGLGALTAITLAAAGPITKVMFSQVAEQERLTSLTRIALMSQIFFGLGALLMAAQYARRRFLIPTLAPLAYNLSIIAGGLIGWAMGDPSPESFLWGGLVGAALGNFGLQWFGARREGVTLVRNVPWRHPAVREYLTLALPLMIGVSAVALDEQWPRWFGQFAGDGAEAALAAARRLNMLPVGMIAQAAGVAAYPFLAGLAAAGKGAELGATVARSVRSATAIGGLAAALVAGTTQPIVTVAYERGEVDPAATILLAGLLFIYSISIPFWAAHLIYTRGFYALQRMWSPVVVGSAITAVTAPTLWVLVNRYGERGVALGSTIGVVVYTIAIAATWHRSASPGHGVAMLAHAAKVGLAALPAGLGAHWVATGLPALHPLAALVVASLAGTAVYLAAARLLHIGEVTEALRRASNLVRR